MERLCEFVKSVFAGIAISIGGMVYLSCENRYVGAVLFSIGLISVLMLQFNLYTGRVGYIISNGKTFLIDTVLSVFGNLAGCILAGLMKASIGNVSALCATKLDKPLLTVFADAVLCGILIYICVEIYKRYNTVVAVVFCIPAFILCGFEHSVADMFYFVNARMISQQSAVFILTVILGNAAGAVLFHAGTCLFNRRRMGEQGYFKHNK